MCAFFARHTSSENEKERQRVKCLFPSALLPRQIFSLVISVLIFGVVIVTDFEMFYESSNKFPQNSPFISPHCCSNKFSVWFYGTYICFDLRVWADACFFGQTNFQMDFTLWFDMRRIDSSNCVAKCIYTSVIWFYLKWNSNTPGGNAT